MLKCTFSTKSIKDYPLVCFWIAVCVLVIMVRIRLLSMPLERDEGEYAYSAQLLLKGIPPYLYAYSMKFPGVSGVYAVFFKIFGQTTESIHLGLLFADSVSAFFLYLLGKRLFNPLIGLTAAGFFFFMGVGPAVVGAAAHATHFVVPFVLASILIIHGKSESSFALRCFMSGLSMGMAILMKQHATVFIMLILWVILEQYRMNNKNASIRFFLVHSVSFLIGALLPLVIVCCILYNQGVFERFWFWTVSYAREYVSEQTFLEGVWIFLTQTVKAAMHNLLIWLFALYGFYLCRKFPGNQSYRLILVLAVCSFIAICPGFYFREHYYILLLPPIALTAALGMEEMSSRLPYLRLFLPCVAICSTLLAIPWYFFNDTPVEISRKMYGSNPFIESSEIAGFIRENTNPTDKIVVLGSEPQIYFLADRVSVSGHIYMYGLMEKQPYAKIMQLELIKDIETSKPSLIVLVRGSSTWCVNYDDSDKTLLNWMGKYLRDNYYKAGIIDIASPTNYCWGKDAATYKLKSFSNYVIVYKKNFINLRGLDSPPLVEIL